MTPRDSHAHYTHNTDCQVEWSAALIVAELQTCQVLRIELEERPWGRQDKKKNLCECAEQVSWWNISSAKLEESWFASLNVFFCVFWSFQFFCALVKQTEKDVKLWWRSSWEDVYLKSLVSHKSNLFQGERVSVEVSWGMMARCQCLGGFEMANWADHLPALEQRVFIPSS